VGEAALILGAAGVSLVLWLLRWQSAKGQYMGDSYMYADRAYSLSGQSVRESSIHAMQMTCQWLHHRADAARFPMGCRHGFQPVHAQYAAIFHDRVGYPLLAAALMPLFHTGAFAVALGLCAVAAGTGVAVLARLVGGSPMAALAATALLFGVRGSTWLARVGSEAPALVGIVGVACSLVAVHRIGAARAAVALALSSAWLFLVRPSSAVELAVTIAVVYAVVALRRRDRADTAVAATGGGAVLVELAVMHVTHSPGLGTTLQDTFTHHFLRPHVDHIVTRYLALLAHTSARLAVGMLRHPVTPLLALAGVAAAMGLRRFRWPAVCVVVVAIGSAVVHPVFTEVPRLVSPGTLVEAVGLAVGVPALLGRWRRRNGVDELALK
jgi:hypothetical protein